MEINLFDLANKRAKADQGLTISDNRIDLGKFSGSELILTGEYPRGIAFGNVKPTQITFKDAHVNNSTNSETIKFDGVSYGFSLSGSGTTKLTGKIGNAASQMIFVKGTWGKDGTTIEITGFDINQNRDNKTGSTITGAAVQFAGVLIAGHRLGNVKFTKSIIRNAGDEGFYCNHFEKGIGYAEGSYLDVEDVRVLSSGRDFFQEWGFDNATFKRCYGENGMKEGDSNHMSCFSINGDTENLLIEDCEFYNIAQLLYSGKPSTGKTINATIRRTQYFQGTHAGSRSNSSVYAKGPGVYRFEDCMITAPNVKIAVFSADGSRIEVSKDCLIAGPALFRDPFNGGSYAEIIPDPVVTRETTEINVVKTTEWGGKTSTQYYLGSQELIIKP